MLTRWQPLSEIRTEMNRLQNEMNRLISRFDLGDAMAVATGATYPALNVCETDECLFVEAELPGMQLDDLEIYANGSNQLSIQGERKQLAVGSGTWHRQERGYGQFSRLFELPSDVDADGVQATLKDGVLTIQLPKREEAKARRIAVKAE
ncbi:MAG: molecular chaperone Hsp20 [Planctomycetes bacterium RBG_16_64_10]|nr:MAG: molecular chaperone Hsp20 [Planctomycetes bacterium RBG_16_64_10]